ncbi:hypothetical protein MNBD_CPR01-399 [hydrothermal vent metagenome]|uniref:ATP synthase F0 sector subunit b n=1 Tax=hydrothermal vent metagenome TaxID=652676 RepID=A0A3B0V006_9ZZZZ
MDKLFAAFGVNTKLLIAQVVNFGILLAALTYFLYKPLMRSLEARQKVVTQGVEDAQRASEKLASADTVSAERVEKAENTAEQIVTNARDIAQTERVRLLKEAEERARAFTADAEARAKESIAKMQRESEKDITRLAILAAEKAIRKQ